jgi:hypothetical protein
MPFIVATYAYASSQGQRMHSARTNSLYTSDRLENITKVRINTKQIKKAMTAEVEVEKI